MGPIGGARVGYIDGKYALNPQLDEMTNSQLDLIVAGTQEGVLMVESEAKELSEDVLLGAVMFGHQQMQPVIQAIIELAERAAKDPWDLPPASGEAEAIESKTSDTVSSALAAAYAERQKQKRSDMLEVAKTMLALIFTEPAQLQHAHKAFKELEKDIVRGAILKGEPRIDGRDTKTIRPIVCEVGVLPRAHGSALFTRGETQAIVVTTLGTGQDGRT